MENFINLTEFQAGALSNLVTRRVNAQNEENEFVTMIFKSQGKDVPSAPINIEKGKLSWIEPELKISDPA